MLRNTYDVLKYECAQKPDMAGSGVNDFDEVFYKLAKFKEELSKNNFPRRKLYWATTDIKHCYDKIDHTYLVKLVETQILKNDNYFAQKFSVLHPYKSLEKIQTKNYTSVR